MKGSKLKPMHLLGIIILLALAIYKFQTNSNQNLINTGSPANETGIISETETSSSTGATIWDQASKSSNCTSNNALPDSACTPGAILSTATVSDICTPGYSSKVRNVPESLKNAVYTAYGIMSHSPGQYEVDHLVSLELGGSNDQTNLWPEPAEPRPGFHEKDRVEDYLHQQVCNGSMTLEQAQHSIASDWLAIYQTLK